MCCSCCSHCRCSPKALSSLVALSLLPLFASSARSCLPSLSDVANHRPLYRPPMLPRYWPLVALSFVSGPFPVCKCIVPPIRPRFPTFFSPSALLSPFLISAFHYSHPPLFTDTTTFILDSTHLDIYPDTLNICFSRENRTNR